MNNKFDYVKYLKFIQFLDSDIYTSFVSLYEKNTNPEVNLEDYTIESQKDYIEGIYNDVLIYNEGLNSQKLNFLLFTHFLILNSEIIFPRIFAKYGIKDKRSRVGYQYSSVGDSSTSIGLSVSETLKNQSLANQRFLFTPFGIDYLTLLQEVQQMMILI